MHQPKAKLLPGIVLLLLMALLAVQKSEAQAYPRLSVVRDGFAAENAHLDRSREQIEDADTPIHRHWEGVIFPINGQPGDIRLQSVTLEASPRFFTCMVRNFSIHVTVVITLENNSAADITNYVLGFPFSTHALYGDHNEFKDIDISVNGTPVQFDVAIDHTLYGIQDGSLYYEDRLINYAVHPLITDTIDIRALSSFPIDEGFDMLAYWQMDFGPYEQQVVQIDYTSNSNDFSDCCSEVSSPAYGPDPYYFHFDLSNVRYWQHPTDVYVQLRDTLTAIWSDVPQLDLSGAFTKTSIVFWGEEVSAAKDLTIPAQTSVFKAWPRCWLPDEPLQRQINLDWAWSSDYFTQTEIYRIEGTPEVILEDVSLPLYLTPTSPTVTFSATLATIPLSGPAYIDVYGRGLTFPWFSSLHGSLVRIPIMPPVSIKKVYLPLLFEDP